MHVAARPAGGLGDVTAAGEVECADSEVADSLNLIFIARWSSAGRSATAGEGGDGDGDAQFDGVLVVGASFDLGEFVLGAGEADLQSFGLAEPALAFGFGDAGGEVVADLGSGGVGRRGRAAGVGSVGPVD